MTERGIAARRTSRRRRPSARSTVRCTFFPAPTPDQALEHPSIGHRALFERDNQITGLEPASGRVPRSTSTMNTPNPSRIP